MAALSLLDRPSLAVTEAGPVYHHTDTARLPWILKDGFLRPGANRIGGFPDPDFLWATTEPQGDMTASADRGQCYRTGRARHVRFTLDRTKFFAWAAAPDRHPQWTLGHVARLHAVAKGKSNPATWWCRSDPLPVAECIAIETRSYVDNRWLPFDRDSLVFSTSDDLHNQWLSVEVAGTIFASRKYLSPIGADGFQVGSTKAPPLSAQGRAALRHHPLQIRRQLG